MAKKKTTKSAEGRSKQSIIVEVYKANPDMSAKDASAKIEAEYGIEVKPTYYQVTKSNFVNGKIDENGKSTGATSSGKPSGRKKTARKTSAPVNGTTVDLGVLNAAKEFSDQYDTYDEARAVLQEIADMGGVDAALEAVNAVESLQS